MAQEANPETTGQEPEEQITDEQQKPESGQVPEQGSAELERLQAELKKVRSEAAKYRTERNETKTQSEHLQKQIQAINKALGIAGDEPDPEALQQELQRERDTARNAAIEAAAVREASKLDIRPDRLDAMLRLADFSEVELKDGRADGESIGKVLNDLVSQFPEWKRQAQNISSGANTGTPNGTAAEIADLEKRLDESRNRGERAGIIRRLQELTRS